jgi:hypothetical protein
MMNIPTSELPDGITHISLFDDKNSPVAERLALINHDKQLRVQIAPSKKVYKPREKTEMEVMVTDSAGRPVEANLSVAVTDAGQIAQQPEDLNLVSYLTLTSDLQGFVEQPSYYFNPAHPARRLHADYLLMTQGWRRFNWQQVLRDSLSAPQHYVEQGFSVEGEVKRGLRKLSEKIMLSAFLSNDSLNTFMTAETNESGIFGIHNLVFADSLDVRLQGMHKKGNHNLVLPYVHLNRPNRRTSRFRFIPKRSRTNKSQPI